MISFVCKQCGSFNIQDTPWLYVVKVDKHGYDIYHIKCKRCGQLHELKLDYVANKIEK